METPTLSTMVVLYKTNLNFDTTLLANIIPLSDSIIKVEKRGVIKRGQSKSDLIKRRSKKEHTSNSTGFCHNSLTIVMMNDGDGKLKMKEITIKIFQNGVFHMTGILDDRYDSSCMSILMDVLWNDCKDSIKDIPKNYEIINRRVVLMNYTTKLSSNNTVAREVLHTNIKNAKLEDISSHYDPDVYPGVKICIGKDNWTAKVFRTGKIILTGVVSPTECSDLILRLLSLFEMVLPQKPKLERMSSIVDQLVRH
jgi:TATA-box binding protein (TBP) (component of TFIID and TFIIIB)